MLQCKNVVAYHVLVLLRLERIRIVLGERFSDTGRLIFKRCFQFSPTMTTLLGRLSRLSVSTTVIPLLLSVLSGVAVQIYSLYGLLSVDVYSSICMTRTSRVDPMS